MPLFKNTILAWSIAGSIVLGLFPILLLLRKLVRRQHDRLLKTEQVEFLEIPLEVLSKTAVLSLLLTALFAGLSTLSMSASTWSVFRSVMTVALFWQVGLWACAATAGWLDRKQRRSFETNRAAAGSLGIIAFLAQLAIWVLIGLLILDNLGVNITALVAGLGIGGVAVALALQNILGDLFASLSITFDQPFFVKDFIVVDDFMGSVEHIGIKSTRLRSLSGEQIVISNADLLKSRLRNYGRMVERRVVFKLGVTYETPTDKLEQISTVIRKVVEAQQDTRFDRCHFADHGAASLDFETVYYVLSADYNRYMDRHQAIHLQIHREFEQRGIDFAYPTQRLLLERSIGRPDIARSAA
ncbi:MAG: mechanosensitive ion channel family protein [Gammaproteobacteria bacterium]